MVERDISMESPNPMGSAIASMATYPNLSQNAGGIGMNPAAIGMPISATGSAYFIP